MRPVWWSADTPPRAPGAVRWFPSQRQRPATWRARSSQGGCDHSSGSVEAMAADSETHIVDGMELTTFAGPRDERLDQSTEFEGERDQELTAPERLFRSTEFEVVRNHEPTPPEPLQQPTVLSLPPDLAADLALVLYRFRMEVDVHRFLTSPDDLQPPDSESDL